MRGIVFPSERMGYCMDIAYIGLSERASSQEGGPEHGAPRVNVIPILIGHLKIGEDYPGRIYRVPSRVLGR